MRASCDIFGYTWRDGHYEIYEPEALWVRNIFKWYVKDGMSMKNIATKLTTLGVPTKLGGRWVPPTVRNILISETYAGSYWWNKVGRVAGARHLRPRSEWIGPVQVEAIVSQDVYQAAIERLDYNKIIGNRRCTTHYLLRGLIVCEQCGRRYCGDKKVRKKGILTYYRCSNRYAPIFLEEPCANPRLLARIVENKVWEWVISRLSNPALIMEMLEGSDETAHKQRNRDEEDFRTLLSLNNDLKREEDKLIDLYANEAITLDKFKERNLRITERKQGIEQATSEIEARTEARRRVVDDLKRAVKLVEKVQEGLSKLYSELSYEEKR